MTGYMYIFMVLLMMLLDCLYMKHVQHDLRETSVSIMKYNSIDEDAQSKIM